jgi:hypothetical protein
MVFPEEGGGDTVQSKNQMFTKYLLRKNELVEQGELRERER